MLAAVAGCIVLTWVIFAILLIGLGSFTIRIFVQEFDAMDALWSGLIACCAFLGIWNLFFPVELAAVLVVAGIALAGLCWNRRWLAAQWGELWSRPGLGLTFSLLGVGIAFRAAGPCEYYDTGLYGAQMVRWIQNYPAVFGLANVHGRLGFNSSAFLIDAALANGPWRDFYFHLLGGFLFCALWAAILPACWRFMKGFSRSSSEGFQVIVGIALLIWSVRGVLVGTTTDEPSTVLCLAGAIMIFEELEREKVDSQSDSRQLLKLLIGATLLVLAVTFKLSVVVFALLAWLLAFAKLYSSSSRSRMPWVAVGAAVLVLAPWVIGRVILSGYPFFPNSSFAFAGDWRVPRSVADMYELWVRSWGRAQATTAEGFGWFRPWLHQALRDRSGFQVPIGLSAIGALVLAGLRAAGRAVRSAGMWLLVPSVSGILFWFWKSPDPRFGQAAIWACAATVGGLAIGRLEEAWRAQRSHMSVAALCLVTIWCLFSFGWRHSYQVLEEVHGFVPLPSANVAERRTMSGLAIYVPVTGNQCWDVLPCTPYFDKSLELRSTTDMRWGFKTEGVPDFGSSEQGGDGRMNDR